MTTLKNEISRLVGPVLKKQGEVIAPVLNPVKYEAERQANLIRAMLNTSMDDTIETPLSDQKQMFLQHSKEGLLLIYRILGKTVLVDREGNPTVVPGDGCRLLSAGESEINTLTFTMRGENLFDGDIVQGAMNMGEEKNWMEYWRASKFLRVDANTSYICNWKYNGEHRVMNVDEFDKDFVYVKRNTVFKDQVFTTSPKTCYLRLSGCATQTGVPINMSLVKNIVLKYTGCTGDFKEYKETSSDFFINEPLREIPNGTYDEIIDGKIIRRILALTIDGITNEGILFYSNWGNKYDSANTVCFHISSKTLLGEYGSPTFTRQACSDYLVYNDSGGVTGKHDFECFYVAPDSDPPYIAFRIYKHKLKSYDEAGIKEFFKTNPITIFLERKVEKTDKLKQPLMMQCFENSNVSNNNTITPYMKYKYSGSLAFKEAVRSHNEEISTNKNDVDNYVFPLLMDMDYQVIVMEEAINNVGGVNNG